MSKIALGFSIATVIVSILNVIFNWDNTPAAYGWFVAAIGWVQLCIPERKN